MNIGAKYDLCPDRGRSWGMKRLLAIGATLLLLPMAVCHAQDTVKVVSYNLLNIRTSSVDRLPWYRTVTDSLLPDILAVQEVHGLAAARMFQQEVLHGRLALAPFTDGYDSDRALYYDSLRFSVAGAQAITTNLRDINKVSLVHLLSGDTLHTYNVHLKAGNSSANRNQRGGEVLRLRQSTDALPEGSLCLLMGDVNIYRSSEPAYELLLDQNASGYFIDPIPVEGVWNNPAFAPYHTQSTRTRSFGGGATGGCDDRFDLIIFSQAVADGERMSYVPNSTWPVGNDGLHYNDSINRPPNASVSQQMADAIHYASDHLPVIARFVFHGTLAAKEAAPPPSPALRIVPNPAHDRCTMVLPTGEVFSLQVMDQRGRTVRKERNLSGTVQIDLSALPSGTYTLVAQSTTLRLTGMLVKE